MPRCRNGGDVRCVARRRCYPQGADQGQDYYEERYHERVMRALSQRAAKALSNAWLKAQGLVSVKDLWCKAQGYTT